MRENLYISIPIDNSVSFSLYAEGMLIEKPVENDHMFTLKFLGGTVTALFYTFQNFRRAYLVTGWQDEKDGEPVNLPGIDAPLYMIYKAKGKKIDDLKHMLHLLTADDDYSIFSFSLDFWQKLSWQIDLYGSKKAEIFRLYNKYNIEGKNK